MRIIPPIYGIKITYRANHWMSKLSSYWLLFYIFAYYSRKIQLIAFIIWQPCKHCFLYPARCRVQNQDLFSGFRTLQTSKQNLFSGLRSVQSPKSEFVFGICTLRNAKTELVFGVCTLHSAKTKSVFGLCTLRSGHSKLVFYTLRTAERKISICFCILQCNES